MKAVVIAHGTISDFTIVRAHIHDDAIVIAADGGALHAQALGVIPHILIGDMDSLGKEKAEALAQQGVRVITFPTDKNETDTHLAIEYAVSLGAKQITVLGGMGTRMDHTLGNLFLIFNAAFKDVTIIFKDERQEISLLKNNTTIQGQQGETFSLITLNTIKGLNITGAKFPLINADVNFGSSLTLSNEFHDENVVISWSEGEKILLVRQKSTLCF